MTDLFSESKEKDTSLFDPVPVDPTLADTSPSEKNLLAQSALMSGGNPVESYAGLSGMVEEDRKLETMRIKDEAEERERNANIEMLGNLFQDPQMALEEREKVLQGVVGLESSSSLQKATEALYSTVSGRETESQERRLATVGELIQPTLDQLTLKQKVINAFAFDEDGEAVSIGNNLGDFAELFAPFLEQAYMYQIRNKIDSGEISTTQDIMNAVLLGEAKVDARQAYKDLSPEEKKEFLENALKVFNSIKTFNVFNDNDLIQLDNLMAIVQEGYYGTTERVLENIGSVLDALPAVNIIYRAGLKPISKAAKTKTLELLQKTGLRRTATEKQPVSVVSLSEQVNPEVARDMAKAISDDETGEVAEVLAGTSKTEAEVDMHAPQPNTPDGSVVAKPYAMDRRIAEAAFGESGKIFRTPGELARLATKIDQGLGEVRGLVRSDEMHQSPRVLDNGDLKISETYTTPDGGFHSAEEAIKTVVQNLEHYGVKESDVTILRKVGDEYVPTTLSEVTGKRELIRAIKGEPETGEIAFHRTTADPFFEFKKEGTSTHSFAGSEGYYFTKDPEDPTTKVFGANLVEARVEITSPAPIQTTKSKLSPGGVTFGRINLDRVPEDLSHVRYIENGELSLAEGLSKRRLKLLAKKGELFRMINPERLSKDDVAVMKAHGFDGFNIKSKEGDKPAQIVAISTEQIKVKSFTKGGEKHFPPGTVTKEVTEELSPINMQDDYIARVDFNYAPRATDIVGEVDGVRIREDLDVSRLNFLDSLSAKAPIPGKTTPSRWFFQFSHLLHPVITKASGAAVDQGNRLQKAMTDLFKTGVAEPLSKLPTANAERIIQIIKDQNLARKNYTPDELLKLGVVEEAELKILDNWKYVNDQNWHLTNRDINMSLRSQGYVRYVDKEKGDEFIGKVLQANEKRPKTVYDPATGRTKLTKEVWDDLEATGGKVFTLRSPQEIDGVKVTNIIVRGQEGSRYLKSVQLDDISLPYVPGHYHISYKDHYFIHRTLVDEFGKDVPDTTEAIMTSPETTSAQFAINRLSENAKSAGNGKTWKYEYRAGKELDPVEIALKRFEVNTHAGLSSQRKRGETLKSFDLSDTSDMSPNIVDPLESYKHSVAELAKRVPLREYLDDLEQRIIDRYGKVLPKNDFGKPKLPDSGEKLTGLGTKDERLMADAKTMLEHYNYMKFGYFNLIDDRWRKSIHRTSQVVGRASRTLEKAVIGIGEEVPSLIGAFKGMAFNLHIALSAPPSQWMVQGLPAGMNAILHPTYALGGGMVRDLSMLKTAIVSGDNPAALRKAVGKTKADEMLKLRAEWERSGLGVGVDKHLIVESGLEGMMDTGKFKRTKAVHNAVVDTGRKIGFDVGETFQLMAFWLANRNDAIKAGKSMDNARHFDEVRTKTRTMTMNMNKSGEMPWNKNSLSLWTQFMISPYKSLTMLLDRGLTNPERAKIATWQLLAMPMPIYLTKHVRALVGVEGTEGDFATEVITNGLLGGTFNTLANAMYKDAGSASWQRNVQIDPTFAGPLSFIHELSKDPQGVSVMQSVVQMSPGLSMINPDGYNPVVYNVLKSFGGLIAAPFTDDLEALKAMKIFAEKVYASTALTRGLSTAFKDQFANEARKRYSAISGSLQDDDVSWMESLARGAVGMETTTQLVEREVKSMLYDGSKEAMKDMDLLFEELSREATDLGLNVGDPDRIEHIKNGFALAFPGGRIPPKSATYFLSKFKADSPLTHKILNTAGYGLEQAEQAVKVLGTADPEVKSMYEYIQSEKAVEALLEEE